MNTILCFVLIGLLVLAWVMFYVIQRLVSKSDTESEGPNHRWALALPDWIAMAVVGSLIVTIALLCVFNNQPISLSTPNFMTSPPGGLKTPLMSDSNQPADPQVAYKKDLDQLGFSTP